MDSRDHSAGAEYWGKTVTEKTLYDAQKGKLRGKSRAIKYTSQQNPAISIEIKYFNYSQTLQIYLRLPPDLCAEIKEKLNQFQINSPAHCRFNPILSDNPTIIFASVEPGYKFDICEDKKSALLNEDINTIFIHGVEHKKLKLSFINTKKNGRIQCSLENTESQITIPLSPEQIEPLFPNLLNDIIKENFLPPLKRNMSFLQTLIWVFIQLEEMAPEYIGLQELINDLCTEFKFYRNSYQLENIFQQEKYDYQVVRSLLKDDVFSGVGIHAEQLYHHLVHAKPLPDDWRYINFNLAELIELYQSIDENHKFYKTANHHLYHLYFLQTDELDKTALLKYAFRSDDQELAEQYCKRLILEEHFPVELINSRFNINTLMGLYRKINPDHIDYKKANYHLYNLQLHAEKIFALPCNKKSLLQFAFRSSDQELIDYAYNLLCGTTPNHFTQICGDEADLIKEANGIQKLLIKEKNLQSKLADVQEKISIKLKPSQGGMFARKSAEKIQHPLPSNLRSQDTYLSDSCSRSENVRCKNS